MSSAPVPSSVLVRGAPCGRPRAGTGSLVSLRLTARDVFLALGELGPSGLGFRVAVGSSVHVGRRDSWRSPRCHSPCHPALGLLLGELVSSVKAGAPGELAWCPRSELPSAWARFPASHELITRHGAGRAWACELLPHCLPAGRGSFTRVRWACAGSRTAEVWVAQGSGTRGAEVVVVGGGVGAPHTGKEAANTGPSRSVWGWLGNPAKPARRQGVFC